jgi:hypothetical protein
MVMVNSMLVNPLNNLTMVAVWAVAGLVGGMIAGKKAGAFVVGLLTWLCFLGMTAFCAFELIMSGFSFGSLPPIPPGQSLVYILSIPLVQSAVGSLLGLISGSGGSINFTAIIMPVLVWFLTPLIVVTVAAIIGATIRKKE